MPLPLDEELDNIERQGFSLDADPSQLWQSMQGQSIRSKETFDLRPTDPCVDIKGTGQCNVWIQEVELVKPNNELIQTDRSTGISPQNPATLPLTFKVTAACVYNPEGKCVAMMTPDRFHWLRKCFSNAQSKGVHNQMTPPVQSFASELVGFLLNNYHHLNKK